MIHPPELSGNYQQRHLVAKQGKAWREMAVNFANEVSISYSAGIFNMPYNLTTPGRQILLTLRRK
jgi:hypothetical protein